MLSCFVTFNRGRMAWRRCLRRWIACRRCRLINVCIHNVTNTTNNDEIRFVSLRMVSSALYDWLTDGWTYERMDDTTAYKRKSATSTSTACFFYRSCIRDKGIGDLIQRYKPNPSTPTVVVHSSRQLENIWRPLGLAIGVCLLLHPNVYLSESLSACLSSRLTLWCIYCHSIGT